MDWHGYVFLSKTLRAPRTLEPGERPTFWTGPLLSEQLQIQLLHAVSDAVGYGEWAQEYWALVVDQYDREMGIANLGMPYDFRQSQRAVAQFFQRNHDVEVLDLTALALLVAEAHAPRWDKRVKGTMRVISTPSDAAQNVNRFLREANVPYQFERHRWIHTTSGYVHEEMVKPALDVLARPGYAGALDEFKTALDRTREGRTKEAVTEATKAVESTMKCICTARGWSYPENATAKPLFDILAANDLVPSWMEHAIIPVASMRNKKSAHGQGPKRQQLPPYAADLAVNLAASSILALMAAHEGR